jgi:hypothetical protein
MKSMQQMQQEMLIKARWDGGYPRVVMMPLGVIALARDEAEYIELIDHSELAINVFCVGLLVMCGIPLALLLLCAFK